MDRVVAARKLLGDLVKAEQLEVRRVEIVARDLVTLLGTLKRSPTGQELGEWLEEHAQVSEVSAPTAALDDLVDRYLRAPAAATATAARNPDLERELRDDPANATPYLVYADWLQERADPLGELIALGVAAEQGDPDEVARFRRHLKHHEAYFLGDVDVASRVELHWRFGFVRSIDAVGELSAPAWERLLGLRSCELLESIVLRRPGSDAVARAIAAAAPASLRDLALHAIAIAPLVELLRRPLRSLAVVDSPAVVGAHLFPPSLERLQLHVTEVQASGVRELGVRELEILVTEANLGFLRDTALPALERLTLAFTTTTAPAVRALAELRAPSLAHLALRGGALELPTFRRLAELPVARTVRSLALVDVGLTDATIAALAETRGFSALEQLDVGLNELTRAGLEAARALAPAVVSSQQRRPGHAAERRVRAFAGSRLQAAEAIADPKDWRRAGVDGDLRWARYRGEADYELFVAADLSRYGCTCPSSIQPCKHVAALALVALRTPLPARPSSGIETRVTTRAGLVDLLIASIDED